MAKIKTIDLTELLVNKIKDLCYAFNTEARNCKSNYFFVERHYGDLSSYKKDTAGNLTENEYLILRVSFGVNDEYPTISMQMRLGKSSISYGEDDAIQKLVYDFCKTLTASDIRFIFRALLGISPVNIHKILRSSNTFFHTSVMYTNFNAYKEYITTWDGKFYKHDSGRLYILYTDDWKEKPVKVKYDKITDVYMETNDGEDAIYSVACRCCSSAHRCHNLCENICAGNGEEFDLLHEFCGLDY